jgi:hypothetical protein
MSITACIALLVKRSSRSCCRIPGLKEAASPRAEEFAPTVVRLSYYRSYGGRQGLGRISTKSAVPPRGALMWRPRLAPEIGSWVHKYEPVIVDSASTRSRQRRSGSWGVCWRPRRFLCFLCPCALRRRLSSGRETPSAGSWRITFISMSVVRDGRFCRPRRAASATAEMPIALMCGAFFVYDHHLT